MSEASATVPEKVSGLDDTRVLAGDLDKRWIEVKEGPAPQVDGSGMEPDGLGSGHRHHVARPSVEGIRAPEKPSDRPTADAQGRPRGRGTWNGLGGAERGTPAIRGMD